eukprot:6371096-Prymnesium_polylepis.1
MDPASPVCCCWRLIDILVLLMSTSKLEQMLHASVLWGKRVVWPCSLLMPKSSSSQQRMVLPDGGFSLREAASGRPWSAFLKTSSRQPSRSVVSRPDCVLICVSREFR